MLSLLETLWPETLWPETFWLENFWHMMSLLETLWPETFWPETFWADTDIYSYSFDCGISFCFYSLSLFYTLTTITHIHLIFYVLIEHIVQFKADDSYDYIPLILSFVEPQYMAADGVLLRTFEGSLGVSVSSQVF